MGGGWEESEEGKLWLRGKVLEKNESKKKKERILLFQILSDIQKRNCVIFQFQH